MKSILRFITVISSDGIMIYHKRYVDEDLNEYLFSGFSSAMVAFSKELGDNLEIIKMSNQSLFFREISEEGVVILSISREVDHGRVSKLIDMLSESEHLKLMLHGSKLGITQDTNEQFEEELVSLFGVERIQEEQFELISHQKLFLELLDELQMLEQ